MKKLGAEFQQFDSDSMAMIVLEGDQPLGDEPTHCRFVGVGVHPVVQRLPIRAL